MSTPQRPINRPARPEDHRDTLIRGIPPATLDDFRRSAAARGITQGELLRRLMVLLGVAQELVPDIRLAEIGLEEVRH